MLKKLLKHEIQATGRYMWIMYLVVVLLSVGGFVLTKVLCRDLLALEDKPIMIFILMFAMIIWFVALCAATLMTTVMNVYRFYKNFLSDEGYLMFTLPATVHELIWSKLLVQASGGHALVLHHHSAGIPGDLPWFWQSFGRS